MGVGVILIGLTSYVPTFLEALLDVSPLASGLTLAALTIGWPIAASQSGRLYLRLGFRTTVLIGSGVVVLGTAGLALASTHPSVWAVGLACFVSGVGLGLVASPASSPPSRASGGATAGSSPGANLFARSMGSAVGVAALGALVNALHGRPDAPRRTRSSSATPSPLAFVAVTAGRAGDRRRRGVHAPHHGRARLGGRARGAGPD